VKRAEPLDIVVLGLSITSSWGNGHATTYRALLGALAARGHRVLFLERDMPWYARARDLPRPSFCELGLYDDLDELAARFGQQVREADLVIQGSFVPDGAAVADWVLATARGCRAFYDIDTPVTLAQLRDDRCPYLARAQVPYFSVYWSFTGGRTLAELESTFGARRARALYCCVDPRAYFPDEHAQRWDLGYMGTFSPDRQASLERLLLETARKLPRRRFVVAGALYPRANWGRAAVARERRARRARRAARAPRVLLRPGLHAEPHAGRDEACRALAERAPVRGGRLRHARALRRLGGPLGLLRAGRGDPRRALDRRRGARADRAAAACRARHRRRALRRVLAEHTAQHRAETLERDVLEARDEEHAYVRARARCRSARCGARAPPSGTCSSPGRAGSPSPARPRRRPRRAPRR
jgi:spore maturation protein CgeB